MEKLKKYNQPLRIMIKVYEDEDYVIEDLKELFKKNGLENVEWYTDKTELLKNINENMHICILDMRSPSDPHAGLDILKKVKSINKECHCIAFTAYDDGQLKEEWMNNGGERWVDKKKPNPLDKLLLFVQDFINDIKKDFELHAEILSELIKAKESKTVRDECRNY